MNNCVKYKDFFSNELYTWCTNCGNYGIHEALKRALVAENIKPCDTLIVFDIGCCGNGSDKINAYTVHGIHGRVIPFAAGAHLANRDIKVIGMGGDGGTLSEGVNHLIHAIRCNFDMVFILHNNMNYALTTGQASAATPKGISMNSSPHGVTEEPINAMKLVLNHNVSFAARGFSGDFKGLTKIIRKAIMHKGFSFVEVLQDCPTYNEAYTHEWYLKNTYNIKENKSYDNSDIVAAKEIVKITKDKIATGVIYKNPSRQDFYSKQISRKIFDSELVDEVQNYDISELIKKFK